MIIESISEERAEELYEAACDVFDEVFETCSGYENAAVIMGLTEVLIETINFQPDNIKMSTRLEIILVLLEEAQDNSMELVN